MTALHPVDLSDDELDLLVTAAVRWRLLTSPAAAALQHLPARGPVSSATAAGWSLLHHAHAAAAASGARSAPARARGYRHLPVDHVDPLQVLAGALRCERLTAASPSWTGSAAAQLLDRLLRAAAARLPGVSDPPPAWSRPPARTGAAVGCSHTPAAAPLLPGLVWLEPAQLAARWDAAAVVVLDADVVADLPPLPRRPAVYVVCTGPQLPTDTWRRLCELPAAALVSLPVGRPWLTAQLADPLHAYQSDATTAVA